MRSRKHLIRSVRLQSINAVFETQSFEKTRLVLIHENMMKHCKRLESLMKQPRVWEIEGWGICCPWPQRVSDQRLRRGWVEATRKCHEQLCSLIWVTLMFHLVCFAAVHVAFFQTVSLMFSVPLCEEYKSVLRCTEVAEVCLETCGNKEIALLGDGEGTRVRLDTLFASGSNGNLHKECQIFPVESQTDPNMSLLHHLFDLSQTSPFFPDTP